VFDPAELARHYAATDVFCYPSLAATGEGLSVAPLEAMAAGAVPVLSQLDCYNDILTSGENGFSFDHTAPPDRVAGELAAHFSRLLRAGPERLRLGCAAQQTARRFDYAVQAESVLARLAALASGPSARR
jgi:glycosyltransferase involved in cell wall biosynthesis